MTLDAVTEQAGSWVQGVAAAKHTHSRPALAVMGSSGFFLSRPWPCVPVLLCRAHGTESVSPPSGAVFMKSLIQCGLVTVSSDVNGPDGQKPPSLP